LALCSWSLGYNIKTAQPSRPRNASVLLNAKGRIPVQAHLAMFSTDPLHRRGHTCSLYHWEMKQTKNVSQKLSCRIGKQFHFEVVINHFREQRQLSGEQLFSDVI
jgi:hypothetical protein